MAVYTSFVYNIWLSFTAILFVGITSGARIFEYINWEPSIPTSGGKTIPYHSFFGDIEFDNVSFTYPTRPEQVVIDKLNLKIKGGQMVLSYSISNIKTIKPLSNKFPN